MPSLDLIVADYRGRELDPVIEQASHEFLLDDHFVTSRAFYHFARSKNIGKYEERCNKVKIEYPEMEDATIQNQIEEEMMEEFQNLTPKEWR